MGCGSSKEKQPPKSATPAVIAVEGEGKTAQPPMTRPPPSSSAADGAPDRKKSNNNSNNNSVRNATPNRSRAGSVHEPSVSNLSTLPTSRPPPLGGGGGGEVDLSAIQAVPPTDAATDRSVGVGGGSGQLLSTSTPPPVPMVHTAPSSPFAVSLLEPVGEQQQQGGRQPTPRGARPTPSTNPSRHGTPLRRTSSVASRRDGSPSSHCTHVGTPTEDMHSNDNTPTREFASGDGGSQSNRNSSRQPSAAPRGGSVPTSSSRPRLTGSAAADGDYGNDGDYDQSRRLQRITEELHATRRALQEARQANDDLAREGSAPRDGRSFYSLHTNTTYRSGRDESGAFSSFQRGDHGEDYEYYDDGRAPLSPGAQSCVSEGGPILNPVMHSNAFPNSATRQRLYWADEAVGCAPPGNINSNNALADPLASSTASRGMATPTLHRMTTRVHTSAGRNRMNSFMLDDESVGNGPRAAFPLHNVSGRPPQEVDLRKQEPMGSAKELGSWAWWSRGSDLYSRDGAALTTEDVEAVARLRNMRNVLEDQMEDDASPVTLDVSNCCIGTEGCYSLSALFATTRFSHMGVVSTLDLSNNPIGDDGLGILLQALACYSQDNGGEAAMPMVRVLRLSNCGLSQGSALILAVQLFFTAHPLFPCLEVLDLGYNRFTPEAFRTILEAVTSHSGASNTLLEVDFTECQLPPITYVYMQDALQQLRESPTRLRKFILTGHRFGGSDPEPLRDLAPQGLELEMHVATPRERCDSVPRARRSSNAGREDVFVELGREHARSMSRSGGTPTRTQPGFGPAPPLPMPMPMPRSNSGHERTSSSGSRQGARGGERTPRGDRDRDGHRTPREREEAERRREARRAERGSDRPRSARSSSSRGSPSSAGGGEYVPLAPAGTRSSRGSGALPPPSATNHYGPAPAHNGNGSSNVPFSRPPPLVVR